MTTATLPPGFTARGLFVLASIDPRWDPEARRSVHSEPEVGPQDDIRRPAVRFGHPLWVSATGLVFSTILALVLASPGWRFLTEDPSARLLALIPVAALWLTSFLGMLDYAIRGARP